MPNILIRGIVIPAGWDKKGNVRALAIATRHEEEHLVEDAGQIKRLTPLLRQEVEILGVLRSVSGRKIIDIRKVNPKG